MQYILSAFNQSQAPVKSKLSKLRHLDSLFLLLLIVAILFFTMFQNQKLREQLLNRKTDYMVEEIFQELIPRILKQNQEIRNLFIEQFAKMNQKIDQNKKLTLSLGRELGLPLKQINEQQPNKMQRTTGNGIKGTINLQVIQVRSDESDNEEEDEQNLQQDYYEQNIPEEQIIRQQRQMHSPQSYKQDTEDEAQSQNEVDIEDHNLHINRSYDAKVISLLSISSPIYEQAKQFLWLVAILGGCVFLAIQLLKQFKVKQEEQLIESVWSRFYSGKKKREDVKQKLGKH